MTNHNKLRRVRAFLQYVGELDKIGKIVTVIGLLPAVVDIVALLLGRDILVPPILAFVIFILAIFYANFRLYENLRKPGIEITVTDYSCAFSNPVGNNLPKNDVFIPDDFHLDISGHFDIFVDDSGLSDAYFRIHSIETNWEVELSKMEKSEVRIEVPKPDYEFENPVIVNHRNTIPKCRFSVEIPILVPQNRENKHFPFKFIGSLSKFDVIVGADLRGGKRVMLPPVSPNIDNFHRSVENQLIQLAILQARQGKDVVPNAIFALRDFWQSELSKDY